MNTLKRWYRDEDGQDLTEWALLLAFVCVASAAILTMNTSAMSAIWSAADNNLDTAADALH